MNYNEAAQYLRTCQNRAIELSRCAKPTLLGHIRSLDPWNLNPYDKWTKDELLSAILRREYPELREAEQVFAAERGLPVSGGPIGSAR